MEVTGKVKEVRQTQTFDSGFVKRELIVTTDEQYPQDLSIEFFSDKVSLLDDIKAGEHVKVKINLRGREWKSPKGEVKYFNTINGWGISKGESEPTKAASKAKPKIPKPEAAEDLFDTDDDLPF